MLALLLCTRGKSEAEDEEVFIPPRTITSADQEPITGAPFGAVKTLAFGNGGSLVSWETSIVDRLYDNAHNNKLGQQWSFERL